MPLGIVGGSLIAAALKGLFDIGTTAMANRYNSPVAQLRRLRRAGLPLSYMYQGKIAGQSGVPQLSIDPQLGVAEKVSTDIQRDVATAEIAKAKAQTEGYDITNDIQDGIRDWLKDQGKAGGRLANELGISGTNQEIGLELQQYEKTVEALISGHEERLKYLQRIVENTLFSESVPQEERRQALEKIKQQIKNMAAQEGLMGQLGQMREFDAFLNSTITDSINSLPKWARTITAVLLKLSTYIK